MSYIWSSDLETGHNLIDEQHKSLFAAANRFADAFQNGRGQVEIEKTLHFLILYTEQHFRDEEILQIQYAPHNYDRHKMYHMEFTKIIQNFVERFGVEGSTDALLYEIYETIGDWLLNHIKSDDFVLASYINKSKQIPSSESAPCPTSDHEPLLT